MNNFFISENSPINTVLDFFVTILTRSNGGDFVTKFACIRAPQYDHTYRSRAYWETICIKTKQIRDTKAV